MYFFKLSTYVFRRLKMEQRQKGALRLKKKVNFRPELSGVPGILIGYAMHCSCKDIEESPISI